MNERGCKVLFSGRREGLQQRVLDAMDYMMDLTKDNEKGIVNFCLNYGSHAELTDATRAIAAEVKAVIAEVGATSMKEMGKVMGVASKRLAGRADGKDISAKVKELLA